MGDIQKPEALWFGRNRACAYGMLHPPGSLSKRGVIICNTLGFDGMIAHRAFRLLADELAARGFWTLRFDYDGEGDSAGGPWEPNRLAAWIASVDGAVSVLRARGVSDVRLVGLRAGASLGYLYATTHPEISGMVLWSPCISGTSYVREIRAVSRFSIDARPTHQIVADRFPVDSLEVLGYEVTGEALEQLAAIDLVAAPCPTGLSSAMVIDRVDTPPSDDLVRKLGAAGIQVEHVRIPGYVEFMTNDELRSVTPWPILNRILDWLDTMQVADGDGAHLSAQSGSVEGRIFESNTLSIDDPTAGRYTPSAPARDSVVEEPVWVGDRLFAIMTCPTGRAPIRRASIVLCNPGWTKRTGPGRLYVELARYWASLGFTVMRLDLGGAGDSAGMATPTDNQPHAPIRIDELREAATWIRDRTGFDAVVVVGLCSGAFNAFHAALDGVALTHVILVNPSMFYLGADQTASASREARLGAALTLRQGVMNPRKWRFVLQEPIYLRRGVRKVAELLRAGATDGIRLAVGGFVRNTAQRIGIQMTAPSALPKDLDQINARGVKVLMILAAGEGAAQYLRVFAGPEFEASLQADGRLVEVDAGDHSFLTPGARQRFFEETTKYLEREFPISSARTVAPGRNVTL